MLVNDPPSHWQAAYYLVVGSVYQECRVAADITGDPGPTVTESRESRRDCATVALWILQRYKCEKNGD
jgi:hypothetical protein